MIDSAGPNTTPLPMSSKVLCGCYAAIAVAALIGTWSQNVAYLGQPASFLSAFLHDLTLTPAARSFSADLLLLFVTAAILMVIEARKHGIRFVWAYIICGVLIAISVTFPLFLIARELRVARTAASRWKVADVVGLAAVAAGVAALTIWVVA